MSTKNSDVSAVNNNVVVNVNEEGMINFELLVRDFRFDMAEMEEHFNKNYLESDKYPQAFFKGRIYSFKTINLTKPGLYKVKAEGDLSIHNVTKKIVVTGTLQVDKGVIVLQSKFSIDIDDYKIETGLGGMIVGSKMDVEVSARCFARTPSDAGAALWRGYDFP
ncbi:MAG TPA: YceI family protein [Chitinophagaceae bacterium]|nr:YceI family protein [Chitinophagaceae bacterium]